MPVNAGGTAAAPLPFTWPYLFAFWAVAAWVFAPEFRVALRASRGAPPPEDRGSFRVVVIGFGVATIAAVLLSFVAPDARLPGPPLGWFAVGLLALVSGGLLRRH